MNILIVEDDAGLRASLEKSFLRRGHEVVCASGISEALRALGERKLDLVLSDNRLPDGSGLDVLDAARDLDEEIAVIMMTAFPEVKTAVHAMQKGARDFIVKPFELEELHLTVERAIEARELRRDLQRLERERRSRDEITEILGESPVIEQVREQIRKVASSDTPVLVVGQTGTGKELVADSVHRLSLRAQGPLVKVNCSAFSEQILESELFGHEKGAFTDAREARAGLFEMADGGTLLLDEISEMKPGLQAKLLRVVEGQPFFRVGGRREVRTNVRVVAATNRDLRGEVKKGNFREDLYFRLNAFQITVPPLRARGDDVVLLARFFLLHIVVLFALLLLGLGFSWNMMPPPGIDRDQVVTGPQKELLERLDRIEAAWQQLAGKELDEGEQVVASGEGSSETHGALEIAAKPSMVNTQLRPAYRAYLDASESLARDDLAGARQSFRGLLEALAQVDARTLDEKSSGQWQTISDVIVGAAQRALAAEDRAGVRLHFRDVSAGCLALLQTFGHALDTPLYKMHCSMAFQDQGAAWLQASRQIANPYWGAEMLRCGSVVKLGDELKQLQVARRSETGSVVQSPGADSANPAPVPQAASSDPLIAAALPPGQQDLLPPHQHSFGGVPHMDHDPRHHGVVTMNGNLHFETMVEDTGRVAVYFSDMNRRPLPSSVVSDLQAILHPDQPGQEQVVVQPDPEGTCWAGQGSPVSETGVIVQVAYTYQSERYAYEIEVAHPVRSAEKQRQQLELASLSRLKGNPVPGAINLGLAGQPGSYAASYLKKELGEELSGGTYRQSAAAHFGNSPHEDIPLAMAAAAETVQLGARAPDDTPIRTYNVSAINVVITLNQYHDIYPGYMFVLTEDVEKVRQEEARNEAARGDANGPNDPAAVSNGLQGDMIQPLAIRANQGERLVINLKNEVNDERVSFHLHGSSLVVQATGEPATSTNPGAYLQPGETKAFEWYIPPEQQEGVHHFHSHVRDQASTGLFGSLVVELRGARYLNPHTGEELKSGWMAMIEEPNGPDFREFVIVYHEVGDETFRPLDKRQAEIPLRDQAADDYRPSARALNYRSESFANNLILQHKLFGIMDESMGYSSYTFGDPSTPIPRSYLGDPAKWRLVHGGSEVFHSHHLHGGAIRWRRQPNLTQDLNLFGTNNFALASEGPVKFPPARSTSDRVDVQTLGPAETHDATIECCSGGCQFTAGDFLYHCHIPHHYVAGMWAFWRVYNTLQAGDARTDIMPTLAELPDRKGRMKPAVDSTQLMGKTLKWFGKEFRVTNDLNAVKNTPGVYTVEQWVEALIPPQGKPGKKETEKEQIAAYDASVWDWAKQKTPDGKVLYFGEPETSVAWPKYKPNKPGERPALLFDADTGKLAWPQMKPHFGKRPPFSPDHNPAPFLEPIHENDDGTRNAAVARAGENGPWSLSPQETSASQNKQYNVRAITLPITLSKAEGDQPPIVDPDGQLFVLHEEEAEIRANDAKKIPLVLRANVGDTVDITFASQIPDARENLSSSKVNMHIHFVQFDTQASDGVISGMSYEQSVRPFIILKDDGEGFGKPQNEPLAGDAKAGVDQITVRSGDPFHLGILVGIGMGEAGRTEIRRIKAIKGNILLLDRPLQHAHKGGEIVSAEFVRYRWFADADTGITYWHDHAFGLTSWGHGLFGALVIEPKGSTYHDPLTGKLVRTGNMVDIRTNDPVSSSIRGSFREFVMQIQDSNPRTENRIVSGTVFEKPAEGQTKPNYINKLGSLDSWGLPDTVFRYLNGGERTSGSSFGLRVEPLYRRLKVNPDPSQLFSSKVHGDPDTPIVRAYLGDPIVIRALDHAGNEMHTINVNGHYFPLERFAANARPRNLFHVGIAERYDLAIPAAGGPQRMAGDYLYYSGRISHFGEGMWGIIRVLDEKVPDLQPLPGREQIAKSAEKFYPDDAPVKTFNVSAIDLPMDLNPLAPPVVKVEGTNREIIADNPQGKCFVLDDEIEAARKGTKELHPFVIRANVGDVIKIKLTNRLKEGRTSFHADMLAYDPKDSLGINVGNNPGDQTIGPGESRTYTFYAHPEYGESAALVTDWGSVTTHQRDGLYGAIVIGPRGSQYFDPATGEDIAARNNWRADVVVDTRIAENRGRRNYRHAALFFQDEDNVIGTSFMPYIKERAGLAAVNYRIEPLKWRAEKYGMALEDAYLTNGKDDPVTPIIEAVAGDLVRIHVFGAHGEQSTSFSIEGHQWPLEPEMQGAELLETDQLGATEVIELNITAGGQRAIPGNYVWMSHRLVYAEAGQWGLFRVLPAAGQPVGTSGSHRTGVAQAGSGRPNRLMPLDSYNRARRVAAGKVAPGRPPGLEKVTADKAVDRPSLEASRPAGTLGTGTLGAGLTTPPKTTPAALAGSPGRAVATAPSGDARPATTTASLAGWRSSMIVVLALGGVGMLFIRGGGRRSRICGLLVSAGVLTYFAAIAMAMAQEQTPAKKEQQTPAKKEQQTPAKKPIRALQERGGDEKPSAPAKPTAPPAGKGGIRALPTGSEPPKVLGEPPKIELPAGIPPLAPLPPVKPPNPAAVELGRLLFFDNRISGDADISCSKCHVPAMGWADGEALSTGYPGTRYFRNAKTILNVAHATYLYWDGRFGGDDLATQARDSINDGHFHSADGRIMLERLKQVPAYVELFEKAGLGEPSLTPMTQALAAFEQTLVSRNVPFDRYLQGELSALSAQAKQGLALFTGKAGCVQCHHGPYLADQKPRNLGIPENPEVFSDPFRIITMRSTLKFLGTPNYMNLRNDPGQYAVTKNYKDFGKFVTPTLREVSRTAPYMHNGMLPTLEAVVDFYDRGGVESPRKDPLLKPLALSAEEKAAMVEFLKSLSGDELVIKLTQKDLPVYETIAEWYAKTN